MAAPAPTHREAPNWEALFRLAESQAGYFTTGQAAEAGYSPQLLQKYLGNRRVTRVRRGVYRLVHFPGSDHEELAALWLWAGQAGVFSHETALALLDLSDALPAKVHLTVPSSWRRRRLRLPPGLVLHFGEVSDADRMAFSAVPVTMPLRTLRDCTEANLSPDLLRQAIHQARRRGLISRNDEAQLTASLDHAAETAA